MKLKWILFITILSFIINTGCGGGSSSNSNDSATEYTVTVDGESKQVFRIANFNVPVQYVKFSYKGSSSAIAVTVNGPVSGYQLSPASKNIGETVSGSTISFTANEPNYLVLQIPGKERLFIFIDPAEVDPPQLGDADVVNIMDISGVDNTGATVITSVIQGAIDSLANGTVLYFPPGTYYTDSLFIKDGITLYLAEGAILKCATQQGSLMSHPADLTRIEVCTRSFIHMNGVNNAHLKGRGVLDGNGAYLRSFNRKMFLVKIENSDNCSVEGVVSLDSCFWNTLIYRSDSIEISNYKVINNRLDGEYNETDGVDFNNCTNSSLYNAFLYTGDDCMAVKSDDIKDDNPLAGILDPTTDSNYINVNNISHEKIVCFSGSSACKVGTKTFGDTMSNISFTDIDVITCGRALVIDAVDRALISDTVFENIRIENVTGRLVDLNMDPDAITWRPSPGGCEVQDTYITNVSSAVSGNCRIMGNDYGGSDHFVDNTVFTNFSIEGTVILDIDDANFSTNTFTTNVSFNP